MPDMGLELSRAEIRDRALRALKELSDGSFAVRMRHEAAARIVVTLRRVALLAAARDLPPGEPPGALATIAAGWDATVMTAHEYTEGLAASDLALLLAEAPAWAEARRALA